MTEYTTGRRWRERRNAVIAAAAKNRVTQRVLADVFDLSQSRICQIVAAMRAKTDRRKSHSEANPPHWSLAKADRSRGALIEATRSQLRLMP